MPETPKYKLIGQNYQLPDLVAKVTGRAKYSEDFRAEGMLFAKLLLSPLPHARIRRVDASAALAMPGEPAICAGAAAAICAVNAAIGNNFLRRTPATPSMIVASLDAGKRVDEGLVTHV